MVAKWPGWTYLNLDILTGQILIRKFGLNKRNTVGGAILPPTPLPILFRVKRKTASIFSPMNEFKYISNLTIFKTLSTKETYNEKNAFFGKIFFKVFVGKKCPRSFFWKQLRMAVTFYLGIFDKIWAHFYKANFSFLLSFFLKT